MRRRALLASLPLLSGCSGFGTVDDTPTTQSTADSTETPVSLPYRGDDSESEVDPQGFVVSNQSTRERYVTVVVEREGETLFVENETIPAQSDGGTREYRNLVAVTGTYRVVVETADGHRTVHEWVVHPEVSTLYVTLESAFVWSIQRATCDPTCGPISAGGEAVDTLPYGSSTRTTDARPKQDVSLPTSSVILQNTGDETRRVRVAASLDGETLLDYTYDVTSGLQIGIPLTVVGGVYDLAFEADGTVQRYKWHVPEERFVFLDVADDATVDCQLPRQYRYQSSQRGIQFTKIASFATETYTLYVRGRRDGEPVVNERYELAPGSSLGTNLRLQARNRAAVDVELDTGDRLTATWNVCPSMSREYGIGIDADGTLALLEHGRPILTTGEWNTERRDGRESPVTPEDDGSASETVTSTSTTSDER